MSELETELARHLGPVVNAPEGLWSRIEAERRRNTRVTGGWVLWPAVAMVLLVACVNLLWEAREAPRTAPAIRAAAECLSCHVGGL
jgi:hypothetical protein